MSHTSHLEIRLDLEPSLRNGHQGTDLILALGGSQTV